MANFPLSGPQERIVSAAISTYYRQCPRKNATITLALTLCPNQTLRCLRYRARMLQSYFCLRHVVVHHVHILQLQESFDRRQVSLHGVVVNLS